jgi:hypothetical protein
LIISGSVRTTPRVWGGAGAARYFPTRSCSHDQLTDHLRGHSWYPRTSNDIVVVKTGQSVLVDRTPHRSAPYPGAAGTRSWRGAGSGARMTNPARLMAHHPMPATAREQTLLLTKTLIVAEVALIAVLASVFRYDFHQFFHF